MFQPGVGVRLPWGWPYGLDAGGAGVFDSALRFLEAGACDIAWRSGGEETRISTPPCNRTPLIRIRKCFIHLMRLGL